MALALVVTVLLRQRAPLRLRRLTDRGGSGMSGWCCGLCSWLGTLSSTGTTRLEVRRRETWAALRRVPASCLAWRRVIACICGASRAWDFTWGVEPHPCSPFTRHTALHGVPMCCPAALLANESGEIVLEGENCVVTEKDVTGHAETALVRKASKTLDHATFPGLTL